MKKEFFLFSCLAILTATITCLVCNQLNLPSKTTLVIDNANQVGLPKNFRLANDVAKLHGPKLPNLQGLSELKASGSSQFSEKGLQSIQQKIPDKYSVTVVDLRQESHGFVNGIAVSWYGKNNEANVGLSKEEILKDERLKLAQLDHGQIIIINYPPSKSVKQPIRVVPPLKVQTEAELVQSMGFDYMRIPVTDHHRPADHEVDQFIQFVKYLPKDTWLHFHCRAGIGRTTLFLEMYDTMFNAKQVAFNDIMERQVLLGGKDIMKDYLNQNAKNKSSIERAQFIERFYIYCKTNQDNFNTPWSKWLIQKNSRQ